MGEWLCLQKPQDLCQRRNRRRELQLPILRRRNLQEIQRLQPRTRLCLQRLAQTNRRIPCSSQRTSQGLGWSSKRQIVRSSRSPLPKNQEPHCSMEIVLRTNGLQGQS